jgi:hypothetical protein
MSEKAMILSYGRLAGILPYSGGDLTPCLMHVGVCMCVLIHMYVRKFLGVPGEDISRMSV